MAGLPPGNGGPCIRAATQEPTMRFRRRLGPRAGNPKRSRLICLTKRYSRTSVGVAPRGGDSKTPVREGEGPENPGVAAPLAAAGCRGNRWCAGRVFSVVRKWTTTSRLPRPLRVVPHEPFSTFHDGDGGRHATVLVERGLSRASGVRVCSPCRAHLFALDVILCAPISLFAFVAESAKPRLRRHGPELHRLSLAPLPRLLFMAACWIALFIPRFIRGNFGIFFCGFFLLLFDAKRSVFRCHTLLTESVTIRFGFIFAHLHQRCVRRFRRLESCTQTVARCRRTLGQRKQTLSVTTANMVCQISCVFLIHRERLAKASRSTWRTRAVQCLCVITLMDIGKQAFMRSITRAASQQT